MSRRLSLVAGAVCALVLLVSHSAAAQEAVEYYATGAVGSVRVVLASNGTVKGRMDFGPYGEPLTTAEGIGQKVFAQITFDGESAMEYADARMFQIRTGRFSATDPVFDAFQNPQKWNRYSYGLNNPQMFVDPGGRNAASGFEDSWSSFCGAEHSFSDCGGDRLFWADAFGGGGGLFEFGGGYADAVRQGYDSSMPVDIWLGLAAHNQRVQQALSAAQSSNSEPKPVVTTTFGDVRIKPEVLTASDGDHQIHAIAEGIDSRAGAMASPSPYVVIPAASAVIGGGVGMGVGGIALGLVPFTWQVIDFRLGFSQGMMPGPPPLTPAGLMGWSLATSYDLLPKAYDKYSAQKSK